MKQRALSIFLFFSLLLLGLIHLNNVFSTDNHFNNTIEAFNKLSDKTNIDVLFFGSSHSFTAFNPLIINKECKTLSFNLGSDALLVPLTDLVMEEAFKKTKPKLVVIEIYPASINGPDTESSKGYQLRAFDVVSNFSKRKWVKANKFFNTNEVFGVYFPLYRNHSKWNKMKLLKLSRTEKFNKKTTFFNNGYIGLNTILDSVSAKKYRSFKTIEANAKSKEIKISDEAKKEIKMLIELAKSQGANVLIISAPDLRAKYMWDYNFYKNIKLISEQNGANYLNLNDYYDEIDLEVEDFKDPSHLNITGAYKTSKFLASFLNKAYQLPDRSLEETWKKNDSLYPKFYKKFIDKEKLFFSKKINDSFTETIVLDSLIIFKEGLDYNFSLSLDTQKAYLNEISKYNLLVKIIPEERDINLVSEHNKSKGWEFDKLDVPLDDIDEGMRFTISSQIEHIKQIEMLLYKKEKYEGAVGKRIFIYYPIFKQ
ncbi:MAG: hypothetical protein R2781_11440 [Flavobacteriaceae bacterium]